MFFYEKNTLRVGNFSKIISINKDKVSFFMNNNTKLIISGDDLQISFYDKNEVVLKGKIKEISLDE